MSKVEAMQGPVEQPATSVPRWAAPFVGVGGAVVGGLYVVLMPVIFPAMLVYYVGVKVVRLVRGSAGELAPGATAAAATSSRRPRE
jgi:hypothetical protein